MERRSSLAGNNNVNLYVYKSMADRRRMPSMCDWREELVHEALAKEVVFTIDVESSKVLIEGQPVVDNVIVYTVN